MKALIVKLGRAIGIDEAIINIIGARFWSLISGPTTILLIARRLSPEEQGFYYTFYSILAGRIVLELGLTTVITQFASHEMAGLHWEGNRLGGDPINRARLSDLLKKTVRWYAVVGLLLFILLLPLGLLFLSHRGGAAASTTSWHGPWIMLVAITTITTIIAPLTAIVEGLGLVAEVTRIRMFESVASGIGLWIGLLAGLKLYSPAIAGLAAISVIFTWLVSTKRETFLDLLFEKSPSTLSWKKEIFPLQWRTGVAWAGWYFSSQFFTPVVFASMGAAVAGRLGMTLNLINVIGATSLAWMDTKAAPLGRLVALRDWSNLDRIYNKTFLQTMFVWVLGITGLLAVVQILRWFGHPIAQRIIDLPTMLVFLVAGGIIQIVACQSIYQRAHKAEPLYFLHVVTACVVGIILLLSSHLGLFYLGVSYLLCACVPLLAISRLIFINFRIKMHG